MARRTRVVPAKQKASTKRAPRDKEREKVLAAIRKIAKDKGLPSGFRYIPKDMQLKKDMEDLAISDIVDELYPESFIEKFNRNY